MHYVAILLAFIVSMGIGAFWYSPFAFGKQWMELLGKKKEDMNTSPLAMWLYVPLALILSFVLSMIVHANYVTNLVDLVKIILFIWIGLVLPFTATEVLFAGKKWQLFLLDAGNQLVSLLAMGLVFLLIH